MTDQTASGTTQDTVKSPSTAPPDRDVVACEMTAGRLERLGIGLTTVFLLGVFAWLCFDWQRFSTLEPHETGIVVIGVAAPLAFFWLIILSKQQSLRLQQTSDALSIQFYELSRTVDLLERRQRADEQSLRPLIRVVQEEVGMRAIPKLVTVVTNAGGPISETRITLFDLDGASEREVGILDRESRYVFSGSTRQSWIWIAGIDAYDESFAQGFAIDGSSGQVTACENLPETAVERDDLQHLVALYRAA